MEESAAFAMHLLDIALEDPTSASQVLLHRSVQVKNGCLERAALSRSAFTGNTVSKQPLHEHHGIHHTLEQLCLTLQTDRPACHLHFALDSFSM